MSRETKKRMSTNLYQASTAQGRKKRKTEENRNSEYSNEELKLFHIPSFSAAEKIFSDLLGTKTYDLSIDEISPRLPDEMNLAQSIITEAFIITAKHARRHAFGNHKANQHTDQVTLIIWAKLPNDNIFNKFKRPNNKIESIKAPDVRSNLNSGFRRFIKKILITKKKLCIKPFEKISDDMHKSAPHKKLEEFFIAHQETLLLFYRLQLSSKIPKKRSQGESDKNYNEYLNTLKLLDYFGDSIIRPAFYLYVDYILYGATSHGLKNRVRICPNDPDTLDLKELAIFLKLMCKKVIYVKSDTEITEENVFKFIGGGIPYVPYSSDQIETYSADQGFENFPNGSDQIQTDDDDLGYENISNASNQIQTDDDDLGSERISNASDQIEKHDADFEFENNGMIAESELEPKKLDNSDKKTKGFTSESSGLNYSENDPSCFQDLSL